MGVSIPHWRSLRKQRAQDKPLSSFNYDISLVAGSAEVILASQRVYDKTFSLEGFTLGHPTRSLMSQSVVFVSLKTLRAEAILILWRIGARRLQRAKESQT